MKLTFCKSYIRHELSFMIQIYLLIPLVLLTTPIFFYQVQTAFALPKFKQGYETFLSTLSDDPVI